MWPNSHDPKWPIFKRPLTERNEMQSQVIEAG